MRETLAHDIGPADFAKRRCHSSGRCPQVLQTTRISLISLPPKAVSFRLVQVSRRELAPRVDLMPLLPELTEHETRPGVWRFEGVDPITPRLYFSNETGAVASSGIEIAELVEILRPRLERLR